MVQLKDRLNQNGSRFFSKMKNVVRFSIPNSQAMKAQIEVNPLETTQILSHYP